MALSEKQFEALLGELAGIRKELKSFNASFAENSVDVHEDLLEIGNVINSFAIAANTLDDEGDSLDD